MKLATEIKKVRQRCFLTQTDFAKEVKVAFVTVNRWEAGKTRPGFEAMKNLKDFCGRNKLEFSAIEESWLKLDNEEKKR